MPFTFSHPAIILPLSKISKTKCSFTGLIIGSIAPDFEYFILMKMQRTHGHELGSFLWFNLPICIILALLYHTIVKKPLINNLPHFLYSRLNQFKDMDWLQYFKQYWLVFIYSSLIGVFSHLFWDSFTHDHGLLGKSPEFLKQPLLNSNQTIYEFLQLLSTIVGGLIVLKYTLSLPLQKIEPKFILEKITFWFNVLCIMCFIFIINTPSTISECIATSIGAFLYGILGSSIYYLIYEKIYTYRTHQL